MKRAISFLLAVVMLVCSVPAVAFAEENVTEPDAVIVEQTVAATDATVPEETTAPTQPNVPEETSAPTEEPAAPTESVEETAAPTQETDPTEVTVTDEAAMAATVVASGTFGENMGLTWVLDGNGTLTVSGTGSMYHELFTIPIWEDYKEQIKAVVIEDGVTDIIHQAFQNCVNLSSVTIADTVTKLNYNAFWGCTSLISVTIPGSVTEMGDNVFNACTNLSAARLEEGLSCIGNRMFANCTSLTSVTIPDSVTAIGDGAFSYCDNLASVSLPDSLRSIGNTAFAQCNSLCSIEIPHGVTTIGWGAFQESANLKKVSLPSTLSAIEEYTFCWCFELSEVTLSEGLLTIGNSAFDRCTSLQSIVIPDGVTSIGDRAFSYCDQLSNVTLPSSVTSIGEYAFSYCKKLTDIKLPPRLTVINAGLLESCLELTEIQIPAGVTSIGDYAFCNTYAIKRIRIPGGVTCVGKSAFSNCCADDIIFVGSAPVFGEDAFFNIDATVWYPEKNISWTESVMQGYGGRPQWTPGLPEGELPEEGPCRLSELLPLDYLAFSEIAYENFSLEDTVKTRLEEKWDTVWGQDGITYGELCANIADWKVLASGNLSNVNGFYAVAFGNDYNEIVIAYRGSVALNEIDDSNREDAKNDWLKSDLPMQVFDIVTKEAQNQSAFAFYEGVLSGFSPRQIVVTGHSLGGGLANMVSARYGCRGETMNAISVLAPVYEAMPAEMGQRFAGVNGWNFMDHANKMDLIAGMWEYYFDDDMLKPVTSYDSRLSGYIWSCHSLNSYVARNNEGKVDMMSIDDVFVRSKKYSKNLVGSGHVALGTTGNDTINDSILGGSQDTIYGGKGNDIIYAGAGRDVLVGGQGGDTLDGGWGDDLYIYYKGDGVDAIKDTAGDDTLYLRGFSDDDKITVYEGEDQKKYIYICCNEEVIVMIHQDGRAYSGKKSSDSFKVSILRENGTIDQNDITDLFNTSVYETKVLVGCPVSVNVLDADGNVVYTLADGAVSTHYTEFGNFYVFEEEDGSYGKLLELVEGYTAQIVGEDTGTMEIEYQEIEDGTVSETTAKFENVPVSSQMTIDFEATEKGELVLAADTDGDDVVDTKIGYDGKPVPVEAVDLVQEYIVLEPGETFTLQAEVKPAELSQFCSWSVEKGGEDIIDVTQDGTVIGKNVGTAYVLVTVKSGDTSITKRCRVDVAQTESVAEPNEPDEVPAEKVIIEGVQLSTNKVTTELYKSDYATFEILLDLPQNHPYDENEMVISDDAVMAVAGLDKRSNLVDSVRLATINDLFTLEMLDDRTVQIVPTPDALKNGKNLKSSYIDTVIVTVQGVEYPISEKLTLSVKKTMPKLKASIAAFNSFYEGQSQKIVITGGEITGIRVNEDKNTEETVAIPAWLTLENGSLKLNGETPKSSDKAYIWIDVDGWRVPAELTLSVKHSYKAPTLKLSASSVTLNTLNGDKKDIQITSSFADYVPTDLDITSTAGDALTIENKGNGFVVSTNDQTLPNKTYKVTVKTANPKIRAVTLTVKTVGKNPTMNSLKVKGTMDVTFPENKVTIGVSLKNYADAFVPELTVKDSEGNVVTEEFNTGWNGTEFAITPNTAVKGSYTATVTVNINMGEEDITLTKTAKLTVKETLPKVKLSNSKVTLNKKLDSSTVIDITSATRGYELEHARVDVTAPEQIKAEYAEGKLTVSLNESAVYGKTYKVTVRAYKGAPAATLSIVVPAERRPNVSAAIKGTGFIDVIRENTAITITPTFTNAYASDMESMGLKLYKKDGKVWTDVTENAPFNVELADGKYIITAEDGLLYTDKYQAELVAKLGGQEIVSKRINLSVKMGSAKLTIKSSDTTLFAKDRNDRALVWFDAADLMLNDVKKIEIKDAKYKDAFRIIDNQDGTFSIDFKDGKIHKNIASLLTKKTSAAITLNLNVFIEGNESTKVNTTQKVKLTIVK